MTASPPPPPDRHVVFAAMRNEGPFILEWVAWYRMLGFEVLIGHNDCTDRSPDLLRLLADAGWIETFEHHPKPRQPPKQSAHQSMRRHPLIRSADWLLICDVDEFLVLHRGDGTIASYLTDVGGAFGGVAFHWRCFGNSGWLRYKDGLVHRQFQRCGAPDNGINAMFKTIFRAPLRFKRYSDHSPWEFDGDWSAPENRIIDAAGRPIERFLSGDQPVRFTAADEITHKTAQMNHYVIRSDESFDLKRGRPSASALKDRYTPQFYRARNRNGRRDASALAYEGWFDAVYAELCAVPGAMRLHHLCCADYVASLCAHQGKSHAQDPRWIAHMAAAEA